LLINEILPRLMPVEKVRCACGCYVGKYYLNKHRMTKKHQKLTENSVPRRTTISEIMVAMNDLEEKIDDMSSGEYLRECNRLKSIYDNLRRIEQLARIRIN